MGLKQDTPDFKSTTLPIKHNSTSRFTTSFGIIIIDFITTKNLRSSKFASWPLQDFKICFDGSKKNNLIIDYKEACNKAMERNIAVN